MYRLLVWSSKGGVGKTTSVANLGPAQEGFGVPVRCGSFSPFVLSPCGKSHSTIA